MKQNDGCSISVTLKYFYTSCTDIETYVIHPQNKMFKEGQARRNAMEQYSSKKRVKTLNTQDS